MKVNELIEVLNCPYYIKITRLTDIYKLMKELNFDIPEGTIFDWNTVNVCLVGVDKTEFATAYLKYVDKTVVVNDINKVLNLDVLEINHNKGRVNIIIGYEEDE